MLVMAKVENPWPKRLGMMQAKLGLSNQGMAEHLKVSLHTYLAWKYGRRRPSPLALRAIKLPE